MELILTRTETGTTYRIGILSYCGEIFCDTLESGTTFLDVNTYNIGVQYFIKYMNNYPYISGMTDIVLHDNKEGFVYDEKSILVGRNIGGVFTDSWKTLFELNAMLSGKENITLEII